MGGLVVLHWGVDIMVLIATPESYCGYYGTGTNCHSRVVFFFISVTAGNSMADVHTSEGGPTAASVNLVYEPRLREAVEFRNYTAGSYKKYIYLGVGAMGMLMNCLSGFSEILYGHRFLVSLHTVRCETVSISNECFISRKRSVTDH
jgi:hypothetical protein